MPDGRDRWAAGATYEDFMGRWSRQLAPRFVSWLYPRPRPLAGCGLWHGRSYERDLPSCRPSLGTGGRSR